MLYDVTVLEPSIFFHQDHVTVVVLCDMCNPSCDCDIMLDPTLRFPSIENNILLELKTIDFIQFLSTFILFFLYIIYCYYKINIL